MATFKTPGVFVEEVSTLPPSVAPVPTSIPGFAGATEKAIIDGVQWDYGTDGASNPIRIESLLDYEAIFGGPFKESYSIELTGTVPSPTNVVVENTSQANHNLYYHIQMFYANGGGTCYVSSIMGYGTDASGPQLEGGINNMEQIDDVTLLLAPEVIFIDEATNPGERKAVYENMLAQCAKLQDRFALLDVNHSAGNTPLEDADDFRNLDVGPDDLKYGASYYPALNSVMSVARLDDRDLEITDNRSGAIYTSFPNNTLNTLEQGDVGFAHFKITTANASSAQIFTIGSVVLTAGSDDFLLTGSMANKALSVIAAINNHPQLSIDFIARVDPSASDKFYLVYRKSSLGPDTWSTDVAYLEEEGTAAKTGNITVGDPNTNDTLLYNQIVSELQSNKVQLYPSGTMAGIYARVDSARGVWQAPANVGVRGISGLNVNVDNQEQANLNVDSVSGKSINVIREFTGRGTLVWGARTLAGNDNEWRYINVRRLFLFVEESIKKSSEFVVFEPNTATTWSRVKGTAESFLTSIWRDGALAGAVPEDAFFVKVGLNETMTADDILNGRMIIEIGLAAVRPAEFIVLRFSHLVQQS